MRSINSHTCSNFFSTAFVPLSTFLFLQNGKERIWVANLFVHKHEVYGLGQIYFSKIITYWLTTTRITIFTLQCYNILFGNNMIVDFSWFKFITFFNYILPCIIRIHITRQNIHIFVWIILSPSSTSSHCILNIQNFCDPFNFVFNG